MSTRTRLSFGIGVGITLLVMLALGGWFISTAFAQGPGQHGMRRGMHNNQAVLQLLQIGEKDLLKQRQAGKSWLDIVTAQGVSEKTLVAALLQPMTEMHAWMTATYPQSNVSQMTAWMREQFTQDIRVTSYGTMTDMHVFGGGMMNGMMNAGIMGGGMNGGMMGGWNNTPNVIATPVPSRQKIDREIQIVTGNFKFKPASVVVQAGETVKFIISNEDNFAHNAVSRKGQVAYTVLPANETTSIVWAAPSQAGTYTVICTWHPGMQFSILVEP